jgi:methionine aminopeptidase
MVTGGPRERLADVAAAAVAVAVESERAGRYTGEVGRTLAAVVGEVGARIVDDAEGRGFAVGWQEAVAARSASAIPGSD